MKGEAEQSPLVAAGDETADVEKRRRQDARAVVNHDDAALLDDEEPRIAGMRQSERQVESGSDRIEPDVLGEHIGRDEGEEKKKALHGCWVCMQQVGRVVQ